MGSLAGGPPDPTRSARPTLREFMTDGALPGVCAALADLTGVRILVRDECGRPVVYAPRAEGPAWTIEDCAEIPHDLRDVGRLGAFAGEVGTIGRGPGPVRLASEPLAALDRALGLLAAGATETIQSTIELRRALGELGVLFELTSMLVDGEGDEKILRHGLESALRMLALDAGSIALLRADADDTRLPDEKDLEQRASVGLSDAWLKSPEALSHDRQFDTLALSGEVVESPDLREDARVRIPEQVRSEGVVCFLSAGLTFRGRPIGVMRLYGRAPRRFTDTERQLVRSIAQQSAAAVQQSRLLALRRREREFARQARLAGEIQHRMLPRDLPAMPPFDLAAKYQPSFDVGGDFYDFFETFAGGRRQLGLVMGDVVGKGFPAAILMAGVRSSLRAHASGVNTVEEVMERVNRDVTRDTEIGEFATLWFATLDPETLRLRYCSAGHPPTFIIRARTSEVEELVKNGLVVGVDAMEQYGSTVVSLGPGDVLVAYTDGVDEAMSFAGDRFGRWRLHEAAADAARRGATAKGVLDHILWALRQHIGLHTRPDDATLAVVRVAP